MTAIDDIVVERKRQIEVEGWDSAHDDKHDEGEMAAAAGCYAFASGSLVTWDCFRTVADAVWPWDKGWWKPKGHRQNLIKAGALIVAEIERLDRKAAANAA